MRYGLFLIVLFATQVARAYEIPPLAPAEVDTSTQPALTIDNWNPKPIPRPTPPASPEVQPSTSVTPPTAAPVPPTPVLSPPSPPASPAQPAATGLSAADRAAMNTMTGTLSSIDLDGQMIRLSVDGGINPQLAIDDKTAVESGGRALKITDLQTGDKVVVRYIGKDLTARDIERLSPARSGP